MGSGWGMVLCDEYIGCDHIAVMIFDSWRVVSFCDLDIG